MRKSVKNILSTLGAIATIAGVTMSIPFYLNKNNFGLIISFFSLIIGIVLLSIAFGE